MRIALVSHCMIPAECQKRVKALSKRAEVTLIIPRRWKEPLRTVELEKTEDPDYRIVPLETYLNGHIGAFTFRGLSRVLTELKPDLVHTDEEPYSFAALQVARAKKRLGIPRITVYSCDNMPISLRAINRWIEPRVLRATDGLVSMSTEGARFYRDKGYSGPLQVAPLLGIDPEHFAPVGREAARRRLGLPDGFVIGFAGRLVEEKGVRLLLEAFGSVSTGRDANLVFLGRGPLRDELEAEARSAGLADRVLFHDSVPHSEVAAWLSAIDVLTLPSMGIPGRWKEQFGHILIEAMASGTVVLGSDSGAIPEVIGDGGVVVPEGSAAAIADKLAWLADDEGARRRLAEVGRRRALDRFTHEKVAETMIAYWKRILEMPAGSEMAEILGEGYMPGGTHV